MRRIGVMMLACAASGLTACAAGYQSLDPAKPGATVQLNKTYAGTGDTSAVNQYYAFAPDPRCAKTEGVAAFTWTTGDQTALRVPADRPLIIWAATVYSQNTDIAVPNGHPIGNVGPNGCSNNLTFTPRAGHTYDVRQSSRRGSTECALTLIDLGTGEPPPDVEFQTYDTCRGYRS